ncbi:Diacylglycerol O-acyltransferase 1 [Acorus calamus]|uniref:diacylglycerol O-acyltransferase n=1 Tax=Acorus calamus TaxID=4465 RepID=A0AAV9ENJ5_ACOCL|nr:Diacylglycerol O-acyltransferase 1 [Acorus calamus]
MVKIKTTKSARWFSTRVKRQSDDLVKMNSRLIIENLMKQSYPRTTCIRKSWVIRQLVKLVIFTGLMGFIIEQYINPIVKNSQHPLKGNFLYALERVLKLSVPTLYVWLCMFYCYFHLWLNILAELLCFGDREFYKDWWNAKTIDEENHAITMVRDPLISLSEGK